MVLFSEKIILKGRLKIPRESEPPFRCKVSHPEGAYKLDQIYFYFCFLKDSPLSSILWAWADNLSRIASAKVGSLI
jgi:hypothetical protein